MSDLDYTRVSICWAESIRAWRVGVAPPFPKDPRLEAEWNVAYTNCVEWNKALQLALEFAFAYEVHLTLDWSCVRELKKRGGKENLLPPLSIQPTPDRNT